ncbi:anti-sigma factor antagonist [Nonomuraea sp. WAC 01424]|uniref:STAS domain-containing protein n=1 Tax=Nonomuraea sp. WAC 01424 TaxID=2203200 RepID=UPI000F76702B|nr:STAS domain-containing protein [Nonomuraea sp. WAC 01424]RSN04983.1 anti-sigma factor antagonist [Nonomuraea sp. WAC 01424]
MTELAINVQRLPGCHVVHLDGELDRVTRMQLDRTLARLLETDRPKVVIDVTDLDFCDSCGLWALVVGRRQAERRGGTVRLVGVHGPLARLLTLTRLTHLFPPDADPADATGQAADRAVTRTRARPRGWPC